MKIAVIGTGISGNVIARLLRSRYDVHVFEALDYIGGHSNTVTFEAFGTTWHADTGFMVFNDKTYPHFVQLLEILGVESRDSDMSFSVSCRRTGLEYQGSSLNGLFAQRSNTLSPRFYGMLWDVVRFNRIATEALAARQLDVGVTVGEFLDEHRFGTAFRKHYLVPMVAAIWSAEPRTALDFPAKFLVGFMVNHGLLQLRDRPQWKTIVGGSRTYVDRLVAPFRNQIRLQTPVSSVKRHDDRVDIQFGEAETESFDHVVFATHADQTLKLLADATERETRILSAFRYQPNEAVLHTDQSLLPHRKRAWASWNYHLSSEEGEPATLTYDLSRLQGLDTPEPVLLTLNNTNAIDASQVIATLQYDHPAYSVESIEAQGCFDEINGKHRSHFCGAYWGYGFHEDGVNSALAVADYFDLNLWSIATDSTSHGGAEAGSDRPNDTTEDSKNARSSCTAASTKDVSGTVATNR